MNYEFPRESTEFWPDLDNPLRRQHKLAEEAGILWTGRYMHADMRVLKVLGAWVQVELEPGSETKTWALVAEWTQVDSDCPATVFNAPCRSQIFDGWADLENLAFGLGLMDKQSFDTVDGKIEQWVVTIDEELPAYTWDRKTFTLVQDGKTLVVSGSGPVVVTSDLPVEQACMVLATHGILTFGTNVLGTVRAIRTDAFYDEAEHQSDVLPDAAAE